MNEPIRYTPYSLACSSCKKPDAEIQSVMATNEKGEFIKYQDYLSLKNDYKVIERHLSRYINQEALAKGCSKQGCNRTLRDTIEEQNTQIEALKRDVLEKTAELRNLKEVVADLHNQAEDDLYSIETERIENARLKAEFERLIKAGDAMLSEWASGDEKDAQNFLKALVIWNAAKEGKQS